MGDWANEKRVKLNDKFKTSKFQWHESLFLLTVGTLLAWSIAISIISGTELIFSPFEALFRAFVVMLALWLIFYNKYTLIFSGIVAVVMLIILAANALLTTPVEISEGYYYYPTTIIENIAAPVEGAMSYITGFTSYTPQYDTVIVWVLAIALGIFIMVFGLLIFNFYALLGVSALLMGVTLTSGLFSYHFAFYVYIFCIISYLIRHLNMKSMGKKNQKSKFSLYAMPLTAIALIPAIALPTPEAGMAARWRDTLVTRPFNAINDQITSFLQPRYFSLAQTGFGGGGGRELGGNVSTNYRLFMRINPIDQDDDLFYMTGAIFDHYTGTAWLNSFHQETFDIDFTETLQNLELLERLASPFTLWAANDFFETYNQIVHEFEENLRATWEANHAIRVEAAYEQFSIMFPSGYTHEGQPLREAVEEMFVMGRDWESNEINPLHVGIILQDIDEAFAYHWGTYPRFNARTDVSSLVFGGLNYRHTSIEHVFRSYNVFSQNIFAGAWGSGLTPVWEDSGAVLSSTMLGPGASYTIRRSHLVGGFDETQLKSASYLGALRAVQNSIYEYEFPHQFLGFNLAGETMTYTELLDYLIQRSDWIAQHYTQLPVSTPDRVQELAERVTLHARNDFERANMIADYLRWHGNFGYTLSPGNTPEGRDFVDWFLFDARQGYCVHFATAFVVMMRSLGIPTRYVEGFMVSGDRDDDGFLDVVNRMGHAWGEVYFEGWGWHMFEATPPDAIVGWEPPAADPSQTSADAWDWLLLGEDWSHEFLDENFGVFDSGGTGGGGGGPTEYFYDEHGVRTPIVPSSQTGIGELLLMAAGISIGLVVFMVVLRNILAELQFRRMVKKGGKAATLAYYGKMLRYLDCLEMKADDGDTPLTFARRLGYRKGYENEYLHLEDIAFVLYRAKYSSHPVTNDEKTMMAHSVFQLDFKLRNRVGLWRYLGYKLTKIPNFVFRGN
ncbi:MAG: transglutaminase-like domain-containing protein [Defluviitaleaceae bacterium]|nr:transglutaminase-like domain-containing protein [Defluviitaleaceae bacterium]